MEEQTVYDPLHVAMKYVAGSCIDEGLTEDAENLASFLELIDLAPRTVGLVQTWVLSQRGRLREALRNCEELVHEYPDAEEFQPVLAVLRYACQDPGWRVVCTGLVASETATAESRRIAGSLLDGTFGTPAAAKAAPDDGDLGPDQEQKTSDIDYAAMFTYVRA